MERLTLTAILALSDSDKIQIMNEFEKFERDGYIDECLLRAVVKSLPLASNHTTMYMNKIAMECYRYFANKSLNR